MTVEGPLELYLLIYGWRMFNRFWEILFFTGLAYLPIGWLLLENVLKACQSANSAAEAGVASRRSMIIDGSVVLIVISLAGAPLNQIEASTLNYLNPCIAEQGGTGGGTGTTYDTAFNLLSEPVKVPLWWHGVLAISYGLNRAAIQGLGCATDITMVRRAFDETRIDDPKLVAELRRFREECYYKARATLQNQYAEEMTPEQITALEALFAEQGVEHAEWEGGRIFLSPIANLPPLYDVLTAAEMKPVPGFPVDYNRETDQRHIEAMVAAQSQIQGGDVNFTATNYGIPTCSQWWLGTDDSNGLRTRLLAEVYEGPQGGSPLRQMMNDASLPELSEKEEDKLLMSMVNKEISIPTESGFAGSHYENGDDDGMLDTLGGVFANLGIAWQDMSNTPMLHAIKASLPIIKAFLLMAIIMFIPILLVASAYRLNAVFMITTGLVAVNFLSVIWGIAWALENGLVTALWPDQTNYISQGQYTLSGITDPNFSLKVEILKYLLPFLYLFFPVAFFTVVGWAGLRVLGGMSAVTGSLTSPAGRGGGRAANAAESAATSRVNRV